MFARSLQALLAKLSPSRSHHLLTSTATPQLELADQTRNTTPSLDLSLLDIPIYNQSNDQDPGLVAFNRGQFLARQEMWTELSRELQKLDIERRKSLAGVPLADMMAYGARADAVSAAEHAIFEGRPSNAEPLIDGVNALERIRSGMPDDPYMAVILALTHVDIGWAWRGTGWDTMLPRRNKAQCIAHFDRAFDLLDPFCGIELNSALIASTRCALMAGRRDPLPRLADDYEDLIDLDPTNYRPMRALGNHMLPRWFGSYEALDLEARRTASRTQDIWGAGGYTWVYFDAITIDDRACAQVDPEFFIEGLQDILQAKPDQQTVNLLASYCAVALRAQEGSDIESDLVRSRIAECAAWLIRDHLTELHPLIWAHAFEGFDNNARIASPSRFAASGTASALRVIAEQFREDLAKGLQVTFTPDGPQIGPT